MSRLLLVLVFCVLGCGESILGPEQVNEPASKLIISNAAKGSRDRLTQHESEIYELAKNRIVNLIYRWPDGHKVRLASGSFVSSGGHILTAAHVVVDLDPDAVLEVKQGSPAVTIGQAKIIFVPKRYKELFASGDFKNASSFVAFIKL